MLSDSWKSAFKMASEDPTKNKAKKYKKNMKLSHFFSDLRGLNFSSYQIFMKKIEIRFFLFVDGKSHIRKTSNLSTDADSSTNTQKYTKTKKK